MSDPEVTGPEQSTALVLRHTGEVVDRNDEKQLAKAIESVQVLKGRLAEADRELRAAFAARAGVLGTKTLNIPGVGKLEVKGGSEKRYDVQRLKAGLLEAGMPPERVKEMFRTVIEEKPIAAELNKAARANPAYAQVIDDATTIVESVPTVQIT